MLKYLLIFIVTCSTSYAQSLSAIDPSTRLFTTEAEQITFKDVLEISSDPIILTVIDYDCTSYCKQTLLLLSRELKYIYGKQGAPNYRLVTIGLGSTERARGLALKALWRNIPILKDPEKRWLFLSADRSTFETVAHSLGLPNSSQAHSPVIALLEPDGKIKAISIGGLNEPGDLVRFVEGSLTAEQSRVNMGRVCKATHETPETEKAISWMRWGLLITMLTMGSILLYFIRKST